jgi:hypothetical protein
MKPFLFIAFLSIILCSISHAQVPEKRPDNYYSKLWLDSPFTTKPIVTTDAPIINPLSDYHLTGIAPIEGGYRITIANKKNKTEKKIVIEPTNNSGYEVISVNRNPEVSLGTTVTLRKGKVQGVVQFEPDLVVLNTPTATAKPTGNVPPGVNPNQQNQPNSGQVTPNIPARPRIIPPPVNPSKPQSPTSRSK